MSHYHWINNRPEQIEQPNDAKLGNTDEPRGGGHGDDQTAMGRVWSASGGGVAATTPDASTPSTPPSLKGILKKAKNDDKS